MLKQQRLFLITAVEDLPDGDADVTFTVLARVRLRWPAPATIQQDACRRHTRRRWHGLLAEDPGEHLDA